MTSPNRHPPLIMGILNVTPDSFSDGGRYDDLDSAVEHAARMIEAGADIIDVGGESTRPGSDGVSADLEISRVVPVIREIKKRATARISVDTVKAEVAAAAIDAGAEIVNDVSMLRGDPKMPDLVAERGVGLVIMHSRKRPADMQEDIRYGDVVEDVRDELAAAAGKAEAAGVARDAIWLDPGIGFAKTAAQCLELLGRLREIADLGYPVLVGPSRKSFIGAFTGAKAEDRLGGTAAAIALAVANGARAVRVHDVAQMRQAATIALGISSFMRTGGAGA